ncbi:MAG: DUF5329 domain-containing protein [Woeseiaceae bacterium]
MRAGGALVLLCVFLSAPAFADDATMNAEIDYLLDTVASSDCTFIRNGKEHGPEAARDHLDLKRRRGSKYFSTTEEFIERLASSSSWTGKPYRIRCGVGEAQLAKAWFEEILSEYRNADSN